MAGNARSAGSEDFVGALAIQDRIRETSAVGSFASAIAGVGPVSYTHLTLPTKA